MAEHSLGMREVPGSIPVVPFRVFPVHFTLKIIVFVSLITQELKTLKCTLVKIEEVCNKQINTWVISYQTGYRDRGITDLANARSVICHLVPITGPI